MAKSKPQRIRDPLHNLIEFGRDSFEQHMWKIVQTKEFQRLRRIKQLGFSEFVYPGAAHTRFSHSLGVYHIAKKLLWIVQKLTGEDYNVEQGHCALAAALVHDIGHGPFSHAFEEVGKRLKLPMAKHERVSEAIIRGGNVAKILNAIQAGFSDNVAKMIGDPEPEKIYGAIVSSQFDADRLDYMQRDRLMAGTHLAGIDFSWLLSNLKIGEIPWGVDEDELPGTRQTFVLGPKAIHAAESYVLALFQLYPTVYFHKTTRGIEKLFTELLVRFFELVKNGDNCKTNLPENHPLVAYAKQPDDLSLVLSLDDTVVMGALSLMMNSGEPLLKDFSFRILHRRLYKCIDIRERLKKALNVSKKNCEDSPKEQSKTDKKIEEAIESIKEQIKAWLANDASPRILQDDGFREPYKPLQDNKGPHNQIMVRAYVEDGGAPQKNIDIREYSPIIKSIPTFKFYRVYHDAKDMDAKSHIENTIKTAISEYMQ